MEFTLNLNCIEIQKLLDSKEITKEEFKAWKKANIQPISKETWKARYNPIHVEILANALQDTIHKEVGKNRAGKSVKSKHEE